MATLSSMGMADMVSMASTSATPFLTFQLTDTRNGVNIWSDTYCSSIDATDLISIQEEIAKIVAVKIASEYGLISRAMMGRAINQPPRAAQTYEAVLRFYDYLLNHTPASFMRAFTALSNAVEIEPACGQAWSMLSRLYANIHALDIPGFDNPLDHAFEYAQRGVRLEPNNQRSRGILAYVYLFRDEITAGLAKVEKALSLNPNCLFIVDGLGYLMTLMGQWAQGTALIRSVIRLNPYYGTYVHYALWVDWLRQGKRKEAYLETLHLNQPSLYWDNLARAASLGLLGRIQEGEQAAAKLLTIKPDFCERGRQLIGHFIKFDDIVDRVIDGLDCAGITVA